MVVPQLWRIVLGTALAVAAAVLLSGTRPRRLRSRRPSRPRTLPSTLGLACVLGAAVAFHCALVTERRDHGPLEAAADIGESVLIELRVTGAPIAAPPPGGSGAVRWAVPAELESLTTGGHVVHGYAKLTVMGGEEWRDARPGQSLRTTGILKEARPGGPEAATLNASTAPVLLRLVLDVQAPAAAARERFRDASSRLPPDAAGLLPGMVAGDTSALPEDLVAAMKTTGMTHLTAVSGANCAVILGGFLMLARTLRLPRPFAAVVAAGGLAAFVVLVGPDPSVLRAAVMGCVGLAAVAGGLRGRSLSFLCLAITALLLSDPFLAGSIGFLLSVLATLGIVLFAGRIASWFPSRVPSWLAAGVAVPLAAQLMCAPVIVALQPQLTLYSLPANVLAGPLVAPVTVLGTLSMPLASAAPWLAAAPLAVAGFCATAVAGVARFFAGLPGAALPWSEGGTGIAAMVLFSVVMGLAVMAALRPTLLPGEILVMHRKVMKGLEWLERLQDHRPRRGRLKASTTSSGRNHPWLLPKTTGPRASRRTPSAGGMLRRPP
ncbi:ComEC/Rec2 family competence protein [Paenarthrobacter sp. NPDC089675]|uniref:ComEC/Rec2 family competence protein n=1 Tax=Paenarthrobacter sp. NPDC089675 TaxID=3364376 RepID=UPI0037F6C61D